MFKLQEGVNLSKLTTFKIGGLAKYFVEVSAEEALLEALKYAKDNNLIFFILGGGSNVLFSDEGFNGLVIKTIQNTKYKIPVSPVGRQTTKIECWAGDSLASAVKFSAENSLSGLEWAAGIPGTIGGAIRGNAGAFGFSIEDNIESVKAVVIKEVDPSTSPAKAGFAQDDIKITKLRNSDCQFSYRNSIFKQNSNLIIFSCVLKLEKGNREEIKNETRENIENRAKNQPKEASLGSFFKNPIVENGDIIKEFERNMKVKCRDNKIPARWLISEAGLQGKKIGGAMISEKHANFIVNTGDATAEDVVMLSNLIKQQVRDKFGVELQEEVQFVGF